MQQNPFDITKAVDFTDEQIYDYWVDCTKKSFFQILEMDSKMPVFILGSKGCGKTHIMRFFSYYLQKLRISKKKSSWDKETYIGIYIRCSGINADRFAGKNQNDELWKQIYIFYWEIWVAQNVLDIAKNLLDENIIARSIRKEENFIKDFLNLFNSRILLNSNTIDDLQEFLHNLQREIDYAVDNCLLDPSVLKDIKIYTSASFITTNLPQLLSKHFDFFRKKKIIYLIDEFENLSELQQSFINALIREQGESYSFRIGSRLYGIKTHVALGSNETNKEGSEYTKIILDSELRKSPSEYKKLATKICEYRIRKTNFSKLPMEEIVDNFSIDIIKSKLKNKEQPALIRLRSNLGKDYPKENEYVLKKIIFPEDILIERTNIMLLYKLGWKKHLKTLMQTADSIHKSAVIYFKNPKAKSEHKKMLQHFKDDIIDLLALETKSISPYYGFGKMLIMSDGILRNLLNILKNTFKWAAFENNNSNVRFTPSMQLKGLEDARAWFFEDNRIPSPIGIRARESLERLGLYLNARRMSDIPSECAINIFSIDGTKLNEQANETLRFLLNYSYLIEEAPRKKKNSDLKSYETMRINYLISSRWNLATSKRGLIRLDDNTSKAIFECSEKSDFDAILKRVKTKYNYPFSSKLKPEIDTLENQLEFHF